MYIVRVNCRNIWAVKSFLNHLIKIIQVCYLAAVSRTNQSFTEQINLLSAFPNMQLTTPERNLSPSLDNLSITKWRFGHVTDWLSTNYFGASVVAAEFQNWINFPLVWEKVFSKRYATIDCIVPGPQTYAVLTHCGRILRIDFYMLFISQLIY